MEQIRYTLEVAWGLEGTDLERAIGLYRLASDDLFFYYCTAKPEEYKALRTLEEWVSSRINMLKERLYFRQYSAEEQKPSFPQQDPHSSPPPFPQGIYPTHLNQQPPVPIFQPPPFPPNQQVIQQPIQFEQPPPEYCTIKFEQPPKEVEPLPRENEQSMDTQQQQENGELPLPPPPQYDQIINPTQTQHNDDQPLPPPPPYKEVIKPPSNPQQQQQQQQQQQWSHSPSPMHQNPSPQLNTQTQQQQLPHKPPEKIVPSQSHDAFMKSFIQSRKEEQEKSLMKSMLMRNENGPLGLKNNGQNNCFMNAVIQSLWNLSVFSSEFSEIKTHKCTHDHRCILCALQIIFNSLRYSSEAVDPFVLRCALAALNNNFEMKKMADASEAFISILDELHKATERKDFGFNCCIIHNMFSIDILTIKSCECGFVSDNMSHSRNWTSIIPAQYIVEMHAKAPSMSFGRILGEYDRGEPTKCPNCSKVTLLERKDFDPKLPKVYTISVVWEPEPKVDDLASFVRFIPQELNMKDVVPGANATYRIRGMVVFYGKHYYTYFYKLRAGSDSVREWKMFDDSLVKPVEDNLTKILVRGHMQPVLLFYVRV